MKKRSFDEMIAYFNRRVADMNISQDCKMELVGMITAIGYEHKTSVPQWIPCSNTERPKNREEVMVTIDNGCKRYTDTDEYVDGRFWYNDDKHIVAWKSFDEPWRGEKHGET